jgi:manganese/iron transport system substrate-binding protein
VTRRFSLALITLLALSAACSATSAPLSPSGQGSSLTVIATSTVFADLVEQVGGERVNVHSLVPPGGEVHTFDPAPSDAAAVSGARLLVMNGLGLDDWLEPFAQQAGANDIPVLKLAEDIEEVNYVDDEEGGGPNPHLWLNPAYARIYVDRIRLKLIEIDPAGQQTYDANATAFDGRLVELDTWARQQMEAVRADDRRVVSFHDAFPYFAAAYGLEIVGVVVEAPGQDPSAADIAALVDAINEVGVKAILSEVQFSDELAQTVAAETGATVVSDLYTDSLGDPPIDRYEAAIRHDVEQIANALKQ